MPAVSIRAGREIIGRPDVTIIIPTTGSGREDNLAYLLVQLENQTHQQFEIIIVRGDRRQGRAINIGASLARGDLLVTMDDDTRLGSNDLLKRMVSAFADDPSIGIAGVVNLIPADAPWVLRRAMHEIPRRSSAPVDNVTESDMAEHPCLGIRKDVFIQVGGEHEWIPRGLDPYLRQEVRRLGYRVVIIPGVWIHHLLPVTLRGILRQYFRNGLGSAYVQKFYPQFVVDQTLAHGEAVPITTWPRRALRYLGQILIAIVSLRWIRLATMLTYAAGYVWGRVALSEDTL